jgi:hypothetical protein
MFYPSAISPNLSGQSNNLTYSNPNLGIKLTYPSSWTESSAGLAYPEIIRLYSPAENVSDFSPARITYLQN